jgi:hypothetical protein
MGGLSRKPSSNHLIDSIVLSWVIGAMTGVLDD